MAVLVEAISIVIRKDAIDREYAGGWAEFLTKAPNGSVCADGQVGRVGFLTAREAEAFVQGLEEHGLVYCRGGEAVDFVVVDQLSGPQAPCRWLSFGIFDYGVRGHISACWFCDNPWIHWGALTPDRLLELATPTGWRYERSLSWALEAGRARRVKAGAGGGGQAPASLLSKPGSVPAAPTQDRLH